MGPDLTDDYWRYGGYPAQVYRSIHDGRAQGMPAWGAALPEEEIWKLVAYIESLGGTFPVGAQAGGHDGSSGNPPGQGRAPTSATLPSTAPARTPRPAQEPAAEQHDAGTLR
jgi:cytochrome c oxidase cbb3-type subunit 3